MPPGALTLLKVTCRFAPFHGMVLRNRRCPLPRLLKQEPHTPSTNTTELHHSDFELEHYPRTIHLPCSREPVAVNDASPPPRFQSNVAQQPLVEACTKTWPTDFYVFEIVKGFEEIERLSRLKGCNIKKAFEAHFSLPYARLTFYEHKARWTSSSPHTKG
jgi:hypothetical protein